MLANEISGLVRGGQEQGIANEAKEVVTGEIERKTNRMDQERGRGEFDVFLCYNSEDRAEVLEIAKELKKRKVVPWIDACQIRPGQSWIRVLQEQIDKIKCAAVFIGAGREGVWKRQEIEAFLLKFVSRNEGLIRVLVER